MEIKSKLKYIIKQVLVLLLVLAAIEWWQGRNIYRDPLPDLTSFTVIGNDTSNSDSLYLLYIWAPWCGVCRMSASNLSTINTLGIPVKSLALAWETEQEVRDFATNHHLPSLVILGNEELLAKLKVSAFPTYLLIKSDGSVVKGWQGYTTVLGLIIRYYTFKVLTA